MTTRTVLTSLIVSWITVSLSHGQPPAADRWEADIKKFEEADRLHPPPANAVVFVGSSSIRYWKLADSFPGMDAINRGFGGSHLADSAHYADRIVTPYRPRAWSSTPATTTSRPARRRSRCGTPTASS